MFPTIAKAAVGVGGAGGDGVLFVGGKPVGKSSMGQASIGFQLGGQTYSEVVFFETPSALSDFKKGNFALAAQASAVALSAGAAANAKYEKGVAIHRHQGRAHVRGERGRAEVRLRAVRSGEEVTLGATARI